MGTKFSICIGVLASILASAAAASAADLTERAPIYEAPPPSIPSGWAGFYIGVHGGYGWGDSTFPELFHGTTGLIGAAAKQEGGLVGGHVGYNWQYGPIVAGAELDLDGADIRGTITGLTFKTSELASVRARLGYAVFPNLLAYGTAGAGWQHANVSGPNLRSPGTAAVTSGFDQLGWTAGAGLEYKLGNHWVARAEYLHYDFDSTLFDNLSARAVGVAKNTADAVRGGVSYKLGAGAADLAMEAPSYKDPAPGIPSGWAGFYIGVHGGYGWGDSTFPELIHNTTRLFGATLKQEGGLVGSHAGYNWQYGSIVAGAEFDVDSADIRGTIDGLTFKTSELASARARLGYTVFPSLLAYGTAGIGWRHANFSGPSFPLPFPVPVPAVGTSGFDQLGWTAGAGLEYKLGDHWVARAEYLHYDFDLAPIQANVARVAGTVKDTVDAVRGGMSYKLGAGAADPSMEAPSYKDPALGVPSGWAGYYIGFHGGYGWEDSTFTEFLHNATLLRDAALKSKGGLVGGHAGYNWQYGSIVTGAEIDFDSAGIEGKMTVDAANIPFKTNELASARARLGYTVSPNLLAYGTAGIGWRHANFSGPSFPVPGTVASSGFDQFGWTAGAGLEYKLGDHWVARADYLHYGFDPALSGNSASARMTNSSKDTIDVARGGVSYKF
jgi:opacity protein-like surface antigen